MYTASGGYYIDGSSFKNNSKKQSKSRKLSKLPVFQISIFLTLFILSFVFGAVIHAYATTDQVMVQAEEVEAAILYETHIVDYGQSLWSIARLYKPKNVDIRDYVAKIQFLNQLETNVLFLGQRILIPSN